MTTTELSWQARAEKAEAELAKLRVPARFPIQQGPNVPWEVMAPHESMAQKNHSQTLKHLAERGGLSPAEAWCVISGIVLRGTEAQKQWEAWNAEWFKYAERVNLHFEELERVQLERDHYKNKVERYREVLGANTNESICEAAERVQAAVVEMREALGKCSSAWKWYVNHPNAPIAAVCQMDAAISAADKALSSSAGTGYVRKEDVVPVLEAAAALAERAPKEPYPKEWDSDAVYRTHVPYCELIALAKALAHAKAKGLLT